MPIIYTKPISICKILKFMNYKKTETQNTKFCNTKPKFKFLLPQATKY